MHDLPPASLPLRFDVLPSINSRHHVPVLSVQLPIQRPTDPALHDYRQSSRLPTVTVTRLLDPEAREPFISLSRLFLAVDLPPLSGLLRFALKRPDYSITLNGLAPFADFWVPLLLARSIVEKLGRADECAGLLEWSSRSAWSVEDKEGAGGLVHNWKIGAAQISQDEYSFERMISTPFPRIQLLGSDVQIRTLTTSLPTADPTVLFPNSFERLWSKLIEWSSLENEDYGILAEGSLEGEEREKDLFLSNLFTTTLALLSLTELLPTSSIPAPLGSAVLLSPEIILARADLTTRSTASRPLESKEQRLGMARARLGLVDALGRLVSDAWRRQLVREIEQGGTAAQVEPGAQIGVAGEESVVSRLAGIERRLAALELRAGEAVDGADKSASSDPVVDAIKSLESRLLTTLPLAVPTPRSTMGMGMAAPREPPASVGDALKFLVKAVLWVLFGALFLFSLGR